MSKSTQLNDGQKLALNIAISKLMMASIDYSLRNVMHVFVNHSGHCDLLEVNVNPADQVYDGKSSYSRIMDRRIHLDQPDAVDQIEDAAERLHKIAAKTKGAM